MPFDTTKWREIIITPEKEKHKLSIDFNLPRKEWSGLKHRNYMYSLLIIENKTVNKKYFQIIFHRHFIHESDRN